jgi:hypothetical protein
MMFVSCKKDSNSTHTPSASIKDTSQTVNEGVGTAQVIVNLSQAASQAIKLNFVLSGTAILNGDYETDSASSITIPAGSSSGSLKFTIYDDAILESDKTIHVKFSSSANVTLSNTDATITIKDNDASRAGTGLQTDLYWDAGSLVDLDLFAANNVVISNNTVTSFDLVDSSEHDKGFESVLINNNKPDGDYYLIVYYSVGSRTVNFTLNTNGPSISNVTTADTFPLSDVGAAYFYGPIHKVGSTYMRQSRGIFDMSQMKPYIYHGKVK